MKKINTKNENFAQKYLKPKIIFPVLFAVIGVGLLVKSFAATSIFSDNFNSYAANSCPGYSDGKTFNKWQTVFSSYGCVNIKRSSTNRWLNLAPRAATSDNDTASALVVGPSFTQPFSFSAKTYTNKQLRQNSAPNAWETSWFVWNYTDNEHFYYFIPKANGWELGKRDPAYPGGQRFLATSDVQKYGLNTWKKFKVDQLVDNTMKVYVNGALLTTFKDTERPYSGGRIGFYTEDADVRFDDVDVSIPDATPALTPPPTPTSRPAPTPTPTPSPTTFNTAPGRALPDTLYGVTTESVGNLTSLSDSLTRHAKRPTTRIVFQQGTNPADYTSAISNLRNTSYVMGEILDSTALKNTSVDNYRTRTRSFVNQFKNNIDIYEIGNELNGEWVGTPADINAKVQAAYDVVEKENASLNLKSAVTLNYWPSSNCYSYPWEATESFAQQMPAEVRNGVDYALLSFYETACSPRAKPTDQQFIDIFSKLKTIFPNAKIGMGEVGAQGKADGLPADPTLAEKQQLISRYYGMHNSLKSALGPRYVGGYFWWYYYQDAVPYNRSGSIWPALEDAFNKY